MQTNIYIYIYEARIEDLLSYVHPMSHQRSRLCSAYRFLAEGAGLGDECDHLLSTDWERQLFL